jgi:excisionase family DNA binding protein
MGSDKQSNVEVLPPVQILDPRWNGRTTFTVEEAGEICRISRASAYAAAKNGTLPTVRIGRRLLVPRHALERLLSPQLA